MAPNKLEPWNSARFGRNPEGTSIRRRVLIVCEDSKSSRFYFEAFNIDRERAEVKTIGTGMNTDSLVEEALRLRRAAAQQGQPYGDIWCVLDRDSFPLANYSRCFQLAKNDHIRIAWANEAFELWYLLHFNYHDTGIARTDYRARLDRCLPKPYDKADATIYQQVLSRQEFAMKHARRLEKHWNEMGQRFPERQNPSTSVHKLVMFLNELLELGPV